MGNQDAGGLSKDHFQRLLDLPFREWINARCCFIQNKDGWFLDQDPHQGDQLTLPHGKTGPALTNIGL